MPLVVGVDSSTQSCKVVVCDAATGTIVRQGSAPHPDGTEVDPEAWWHALLTAITAAGGLDDVSALAVGGQQHGMIVLDASGRVIRPALLWNDTRSSDAARELTVQFPDIVTRTGTLPVASFTATKLRWLRNTEPANAQRVTAVCLPHDWLTWRLRGYGPADDSPLGPILAELTTDRSDASGTGYWSPTTGHYDREVLGAALGHDAVLPRVLGPREAAGVTAEMNAVHGVRVPGGITVGPGAGDNAAASLGLSATSGDVVISLGTSGTVCAVSDSPAVDESGTVAGFADALGGYLPLSCTLNAARVLDSVARVLGVDHAELGRLALAAPAGSGGLVLQPYFEGERTPNLPDATATLFGMTLHTFTREFLARAAIEGMLCSLADGFDIVTRYSAPARRILLIGGGARSKAVVHTAAEVFSVPVVVPEPGEYVALGAARQAAWVVSGLLPDWPVAVAATPPVATVPTIRQQYTARAER